jgi:HlyD family secretion protein
MLKQLMALMNSRQSNHFYALAAGVLTIGALTYWRSQPPEVKVLQAETNVPVILFGLGQVDAERVSQLGFEVDGVLSEIFVKVGDHITMGSVVARLDSRRQELAAAIVRRSLHMAEATVLERETQVATTNGTLTLKEQIAKRARTLQDRGTGSVATAQDVEVERQIAESDQHRAMRALETARAAVEQSQAQLAQEEETLARHRLIAPYDGIVTERLQNVGAAIPMGTAVVTLMDPTSLRVLAYVDEGSAGMLRVGQPVSISLRSRSGDDLSGHIDRIDPRSDRVTEERRIYVVFDSPTGELFLDEQAEVRIEVGTVERAILVPEMLVRNRDGAQGSVWAVKDGRLFDARVIFGRRLADGRLELRSNLPSNMQIIGQRLPNAEAGAEVQIQERGGS